MPKKNPKARGTEAPFVEVLPTLADCRKAIDGIDRDIIALLDRRARVAKRVGELKAAQGADFFDAGRHLQLLGGISRRGSGDFPRSGLRFLFGEILSSCLNLQSPQKVALLGQEGGAAHIAALRAFGRAATYLPTGSIETVFDGVVERRVNFGVVPIERSRGGLIHTTMDELLASDLSICAEVPGLPISDAGAADRLDHASRFVVIGRQNPSPTGHDRTSLALTLRQKPGELCRMLHAIAERSVNLEKIESRIVGQDGFFYVDIEGHVTSPEVQATIDAMMPSCLLMGILGSYPVEQLDDDWV